jgi:acetyl esterase/lipase
MPTVSELLVNGAKHRVGADADRTLLSVLRDDLNLTGCKYGCGEGECGACAVLLDGAAVRSCRTRGGAVGARAITTVEGLEQGGKLHPVQQALLDADAKDAVDKFGCRPAFQALICPGRSGDIEPTKDVPPVFLCAGYGDRKDISEGLAEVYLRFKRVNVPAELHLYAGAGHGFGLRATNKSPAGAWPLRFEEWLGDLGFRSRK